MPRDYMGPVPAWAEKSAYFRALVEDGKVIVSDSRTKKEKAPAPPEEPPAGETGGGE